MRARLVVVVVLAVVVMVCSSPQLDMTDPLESEDIIQAVNSAQTTWKAGRNFGDELTKSYLKNLLGHKRRPGDGQLPPLEDEEDGSEDIELPESFDARTKWSNCVSLQEVRDQGKCGSCWAVSVAAALTDRFCIATKGEFNGHLSAQDLMSCSSLALGCIAGHPFSAWFHLKHTGISTGGDYNSAEGCQPYTVPACEHYVTGPRKNCSSYGDYPTPKCQQTCYNKQYKEHSKDQDLHLIKSAFSISDDVEKMQKQIYKYGPLVARYEVFEDFYNYTSGVYIHRTGESHGWHAVKVIGWGNEDGTDYWLVANSWNTDWGDKGFFKIRRGTDECSFESEMSGGYPLL